MLKTILKLFFIVTILNKLILEILGNDLVVNYFDEIICIILFFYLVFKNKIPKTYSILIIIFVGINIISTIQSNFPLDFNRFFLDIFLFLKPIIFIMALSRVDRDTFQSIFYFFFKISRAYIFLAILLLPIHYIFEIFSIYDTRFGLKSYSFIAHNAGEFLNIVLITGIISTMGKIKWQNNIFITFCLILLISTLRYKAFVVAFAYLLFQNRIIFRSSYNFLKRKVLEKKLFSIRTFLAILPLTILILIPGWTQFDQYFLTTDEFSPRLLLTIEGINIFNENFPFGVGPGYYGSAAASFFYSPVYTDLGWDNNWGLGEDPDVNFLNDNFWPMILAQYGLAGLIVVLLIYKKFIYDYLSFKSSHSFVYSLLSLFSLIIGTIGSAIFIGYLGLFYILNKFIIDNAPK